jgi:uncharacterized protein DUF3857/transglutaminase superfamily protein
MRRQRNGLHLAWIGGAICLSACILGGPATAAGADWPVIAPADLSLDKPTIDPNADAEVLLWDVRVTDSDEHDLSTILEHHLRIKIFNDRGRETYSKVDISYSNDARVRDVEGRTVSPTGVVTELRNQDVFDRKLIEAGGLSLKAKSFVLPAVVPGSIIEYRWREIRDDSLADGVEVAFYRDIPVHVARYHIKPLSVRSLGYQMRFQAFNLTQQPTVNNKEPNGYTGVEMTNVPAVRREPLMPPSLSLGPWMLLYYADLGRVDHPADRFWPEFGRDAFDAYKERLKLTSQIRTAAAEATKAAATEPDKVRALVQFVRAKVRREVSGVGRGKRKENKNASDALSRGVGDGVDQTLLFTALATAAGLDARLAMFPDRSDFISQPDMKQPYFLRHLGVAVRNGNGWLFVDPANRHAGGELAWKYEGQYALLLDEKAPEMVKVPVEEPGVSKRKRTASLKLLENGTLEGDVTLEYTGQAAAQRRDRDFDETPAERERAFTEDFVKRLPGSEISAFSIEHVDDIEAPYVIHFTLRAVGYGQRVGSRILLQPAVLERGADALFSASARKYHMYFPFAWSEEDTVTIDLPEGFEVEPDNGPVSAALDVTSLYAGKVAISSDRHQLTYTRNFGFGARGSILYQPADYKAVKAFFDTVDRSDGFTVSLRRPAAGSAK